MSVYRSKAFVYQGRPGDVTKETIEIECGSRDLIIETLICARCGTDKTIYRRGHSNVDKHAPIERG